MELFSDLLYVAIFLFIAIGIFIAAREFVCWYFKINEHMERQQRIESLLKQIAHEQQVANQATTQPPPRSGVPSPGSGPP